MHHLFIMIFANLFLIIDVYRCGTPAVLNTIDRMLMFLLIMEYFSIKCIHLEEQASLQEFFSVFFYHFVCLF